MHLAARATADGTPNAVARLRAELAAAGTEVLDLTDSNPTRHGLTHPGVLDAVARATARAGRYQPDPHGPRVAREALAARYGGEPDEYFLTASTSEAYGWLLTLLADPGEAVAVPAPGYPLVEPLARLAAVRTTAYPVHYVHPYGWTTDTTALAAVVARPDVRGLVVVNPGNPTGAYVADDERVPLVEAAHAGRAALVVDEVFGPYHLDAPAPRTLAGEDRVLTFALDGLSKLLCAPQLKLGWIRVSGPSEQVAAATAALETIADTYLSVGAPVALALPDLLELADEAVATARGRLVGNLATARALLDDGGWRVRRCDGGWTVLVDVPRWLPDDELVATLLRDAHLAVHPGWFYDLPTPGALALSLLPEREAFGEGCRRLRAAVDALGA
ncbi:MAG TPA: pyridoxal phosphate-dependent aminotransferase [Cellulomonas sp.]